MKKNRNKYIVVPEGTCRQLQSLEETPTGCYFKDVRGTIHRLNIKNNSKSSERNSRRDLRRTSLGYSLGVYLQ